MNRMFLSCFWLAASLAFVPLSSIAGENVWTTNGPSGASVNCIATHPSNPSILFAGTDGDGFFRSDDGGDTWLAVPTGATQFDVLSVAFDPLNSATVYMGTNWGGVLKSLDGGKTWTPSNTGLTYLKVNSLVVDPSLSSTLYLGDYAGIFKSVDGGGSWTPANTGLSDDDILALAINPSATSTLYAGTDGGGFFKSTDGGSKWHASNAGLTTSKVLSLAVDPASPSNLYAGTNTGVFMSPNGGGAWIQVSDGLPAGNIVALAIDPSSSETIYAGMDAMGVFKSTDGGESWSQVNGGLTDLNILALAINASASSTLYVGTVRGGVYRSTNDGETWGRSSSGFPCIGFVQSLVINPSIPATLYAGTYYDGVLKSPDGGSTWDLASFGLTTYRISQLAIDPSTPTILYAATDKGIFKSTNGGDSWVFLSNDFGSYGAVAIEIDPLTPSTLFLKGNSGIFKSMNGGSSWFLLSTDLNQASIQEFVIDPSSPLTMYAATSGHGIWKSSDGGSTWYPINSGISDSTSVYSLVIDPSAPSTLYAASYSAGVLKTTNGGGLWTRCTNGIPSAKAWVIAIDSQEPATLYADIEKEGVYKTTDGGDSWVPLNAGWKPYSIHSIVMDSGNPKTIYADNLGIYSLTMTCTSAPGKSSNPSPPFGADGQNLSLTLSWDVVDGAAYDIYFGTANPPPFKEMVLTNSLPVGPLTPNTTYYWKVVPTNVCGQATNCQVWIFITGSCALSCTASAAPVSGASPLSVSFSASANPSGCSGTPSYFWAFGDGSTSSEHEPGHTYYSDGYYTWTMTATVDGTTCTKNGTIIVGAGCTLTCTATVPLAGTANQPVQFQATATPSGCTGSPSYSWTFGDGGTSAQQNPSHAYIAAGTYGWSLTVSIGGATCTRGGSITIGQAPACTIICTANASPTSGTAPLQVTFGATVTTQNCTGSPVFSWSFGDGQASSLQNTSHTYSNPGAYGWSMTVTADGKTCTKSGTVQVDQQTCTVTCQASATLEGGTSLAVHFDALATAAGCSGPIDYSWDFGDGQTSDHQGVTHTYGQPGDYDWKMTAQADSTKCIKSGTVRLSTGCSLSCAASAPASAEVGLAVAFSAEISQTNCTGQATVVWDFGDGQQSSEEDPTHSYIETGSYNWVFSAAVGGKMCVRTGSILISDSSAAAKKSVIVTNSSRLAALFGEAEANMVMARLGQLAAHDKVNGAVVDLKKAPDLQPLYSAWDQSPTDPAKANQLAKAIRLFVRDLIKSMYVNAKFLVLAGDDRVIPFFRLEDWARTFPEIQYRYFVDCSTAQGAATCQNKYFTDNLYGDLRDEKDFDRTGVGEMFMALPELAMGRLVETPQEIAKSVDTFMEMGGKVRLDKVLVTGYDFLADSASDIAEVFTGAGCETDTLLGDSWSAAELRSSLLDLPAHSLNNLNDHSDHWGFGTPGEPPADKLDTAQMEAAGPGDALKGSVFYNVGCHSGLNAPDTWGQGYHPLDLPQFMLRHGAAVYIGNTGFGWGLRNGSGYSEKMLELLTKRIMERPELGLGDALNWAKRLFFVENQHYDVFDEKVLFQCTLYGLPMYGLEIPALAKAHPMFSACGQDLQFVGSSVMRRLNPEKVSPEGPPGLIENTNEFSNIWNNLQRVDTADGRHYYRYLQVNAEIGEALQPMLVFDCRLIGADSHGAVFLDGDFRVEPGYDPVLGSPASNNPDAGEGPIAPGMGGLIGTISTTRVSSSPSRAESDLDLTRMTACTGYFDGERENLFDRMRFVYYWSSSEDFDGPQITDPGPDPAAFHTLEGYRAKFAARVEDATGVYKVLITHTDYRSRWASLELAKNASSGLWEGTLDLAGDEGYFIQAIDNAGNTSTISRLVEVVNGDSQKTGKSYLDPRFFKISTGSQDIPGDCDGNGTVSIGEVQKAINMFLGAAAPDCGVDCDGNGQVSIGELQKVINAFLGLASQC